MPAKDHYGAWEGIIITSNYGYFIKYWVLLSLNSTHLREFLVVSRVFFVHRANEVMFPDDYTPDKKNIIQTAGNSVLHR